MVSSCACPLPDSEVQRNSAQIPERTMLDRYFWDTPLITRLNVGAPLNAVYLRLH